MSIDTITFLEIGLCGFFLIWSYRHFGGYKEKLTDFEYLAFSTFWGVMFVGFIQWAMRHAPDKFAQMMNSPFVAAIVLSVFAFIFGAGFQLCRKLGEKIAERMLLKNTDLS